MTARAGADGDESGCGKRDKGGSSGIVIGAGTGGLQIAGVVTAMENDKISQTLAPQAFY